MPEPDALSFWAIEASSALIFASRAASSCFIFTRSASSDDCSRRTGG